MSNDPILSCQVILAPATGRSASDVTAANLDAHLPSPAAVSQAREAFARAGFSLGATVGNSFAITGPRAQFRDFFGPHDEHGLADGQWPLAALPASLRSLLLAVSFSRPQDFGPVGFS